MNKKKTSSEKSVEKKAKSPYEKYTEAQIKAAFEIFDEDRNGRAKIKHLGTILRALGRVVTNEELKELRAKLEDREFPKYMRVEALVPVATKLLLRDSYKSASQHTLQRAFSILDRDRRGCIDADYLRRIFKEYGEDIEDEVMEKLINDSVEPGTKAIKYKEFCEKLVVPQCFDITENRRRIRLELSRESSRVLQPL